jgi:hypothetical protein
MPARNSIFALVISVFAATAFAQLARPAGAANECLSKPNAAAPQGQHWYYRIDRQNSNRHCWRLGPEGLRVQKIDPQVQKPKPQAATQPEAPPRTRLATTGMASARADASSEFPANATAAVASLGAPKFLELPISLLPRPQTPTVEPTQSATETDSAQGVGNRVIATAGDPVPSAAAPVQEPQQRADPPAPPAGARVSGEVDHTFAFIVIVLVFLVIAGPTLHFAERRRRRTRLVSSNQPPAWAPTVALNTGSHTGPVPPAPDLEIGKRSVPRPSFDQSERLAQALQQLLDRMQLDLAEQSTMHAPRRPETGMTRTTR